MDSTDANKSLHNTIHKLSNNLNGLWKFNISNMIVMVFKVHFVFPFTMGFGTDNQMEASGIIAILEKFYELGWKHVFCEVDSMILVSLLNKRSFDDSSW